MQPNNTIGFMRFSLLFLSLNLLLFSFGKDYTSIKDSLTELTITALSEKNEQCLEHARVLFEFDSSQVQSSYLLAKAYAIHGNSEMSGYYVKKTLASDSLFLPALILKAESLLQQNDVNGAKSIIATINGYFPHSSSAHYLNAKMALFTKENTVAEEEAKVALQLDSTFQEARLVLALAVLYNGNYSLAVTEFEKVLPLIIHEPVYLNNYAVALLEMKQFDQAAEILARASVQDSSNYYLYFNKGLALYSSQSFSEALHSFDKVLQTGDSIPILHYLRAKCFIHLNKFEEAHLEFGKYKKLSGHTGQEREIKLFELSYWLSKNWYLLLAIVVFILVLIFGVRTRKA